MVDRFQFLKQPDLILGWLTKAIPSVLSGDLLEAIQTKGMSAEELF
jgi:hypothetical protein